jgi:hypothetical protein
MDQPLGDHLRAAAHHLGGGLPAADLHPGWRTTVCRSPHARFRTRLAGDGGAPRHDDRVVQECGAGLVEVRRGDDLLSFAAPPTIRDGALEEEFLDKVVAAFGISRDQVLDHQWVDNGPGWAVVRLATAQEVLELEPDLSLISTAMVGAAGAYPEGAPYDFEMRTFAPGVAEDPVCGSERLGRPVAHPHRNHPRQLPGLPGLPSRPSRCHHHHRRR